MIEFIVGIVIGVVLGMMLYHWVLGTAGWAGRFVQGKVNKRLTKIGRDIGIIGEAKKPKTGSRHRGHSLRKRG